MGGILVGKEDPMGLTVSPGATNPYTTNKGGGGGYSP